MVRKLDGMRRAALRLAVAVAVALPAIAPGAAVAAGPAGAPPAPAAAPDRFAQLQQRLAITPAQQAQFAAFVAAMRQNEAARAAFLRQNPPGRRRTALDELRVETDAAELDARRMRRLLPAFAALYASLSPQQKRVADQLFAAPRRR